MDNSSRDCESVPCHDKRMEDVINRSEKIILDFKMESGAEGPIIGILAQEVTEVMKKKYPYSHSYIAASYVKAIESSGAQVVPIFLDKSEEYYRTVIHSINGLVLPGGNTWFYEFDDKTPKETGYLRAAELLYSEIKKINRDNKEIFPILGICLGFEVMLFIDALKKEYRNKMKNLNQSMLQLDLNEGYENSRLFKNLAEHEKNIAAILKEPINYFSHQFYITKKTVEDKFQEEWNILASSEAKTQKIIFISVIESKSYPFVGVQFHPEKIYEWTTKLEFQHSHESISACRFFFDWLINQSKLNKHKFSNSELEKASSIYNYHKTFTASKLNFSELYLFDNYNNSLIIMNRTSLIHFVM